MKKDKNINYCLIFTGWITLLVGLVSPAWSNVENSLPSSSNQPQSSSIPSGVMTSHPLLSQGEFNSVFNLCNYIKNANWWAIPTCDRSSQVKKLYFYDTLTNDLIWSEEYQSQKEGVVLTSRIENQPVSKKAILVQSQKYAFRSGQTILTSVLFYEPLVSGNALYDSIGRIIKRKAYIFTNNLSWPRLVMDYDIQAGLAKRLKFFQNSSTINKVMEFNRQGNLVEYADSKGHVPFHQALRPQQQSNVLGGPLFKARCIQIDNEIKDRLAKGEVIDLVLIGDSITQGWTINYSGGETGINSWNSFFVNKGWHPINLGIAVDRTENVLWRLQNGEVYRLKPKVVVLNIGSNNIFTGDSEDQTVEGVGAILMKIRLMWPEAKVVMMGVFPRGAANDFRRKNIVNINNRLVDYAIDPSVQYLNINSSFLNQDNSIKINLFPDLTHPNAAGYQVWAQALDPVLKNLKK